MVRLGATKVPDGCSQTMRSDVVVWQFGLSALALVTWPLELVLTALKLNQSEGDRGVTRHAAAVTTETGDAWFEWVCTARSRLWLGANKHEMDDSRKDCYCCKVGTTSELDGTVTMVQWIIVESECMTIEWQWWRDTRARCACWTKWFGSPHYNRQRPLLATMALRSVACHCVDKPRNNGYPIVNSRQRMAHFSQTSKVNNERERMDSQLIHLELNPIILGPRWLLLYLYFSDTLCFDRSKIDSRSQNESPDCTRPITHCSVTSLACVSVDTEHNWIVRVSPLGLLVVSLDGHDCRLESEQQSKKKWTKLKNFRSAFQLRP